MKKYSGENKKTENLTFTLNYADGTKMAVEEGILFSVDEEGKMDVHIGVDKVWKLFGVYLCLMEIIESLGLYDLFTDYLLDMAEKKEKGGGSVEKGWCCND